MTTKRFSRITLITLIVTAGMALTAGTVAWNGPVYGAAGLVSLLALAATAVLAGERSNARVESRHDGAADDGRVDTAGKEPFRTVRCLDNMAYMCCLIGRDTIIRYMNRSAAGFFGVADHHPGATLSCVDLLPERNRQRALEEYRRLIDGDSLLAGDVELTVLDREGNERLTSWRPVPMGDDGGMTDEVLVIGEDITMRNEMVRRLKQSENQLDSIIQTIPDIVYRLDAEGRITFISDAIRQYGYEPEELVGRDIFDLIHPADREKARFRVNERRTGDRKTRAFEVRLLMKDMTPVPFECKATGILFMVTSEGLYSTKRPMSRGFTGTQGIARDITVRKQLETQLFQAQKMEIIGRLAGGVAHDFNNMLTVILGNTQMCLDVMGEDASIIPDLREIENAANKAADLTSQLLAFSRKQHQVTRTLSMNDLVRDIHRMIRRLIGEDIDLILDLTEDLWLVDADQAQIEQVLVNLSVNARDAMPEGGRLIVETRNAELDENYRSDHVNVVPGPYVLISVTDTGAGMTEDVRERIFDPFYTTKEMGKGTGLGLSTCYGIVKQNNGYIWVYSEAGRGSTFKVYLPRSNGEKTEGQKRRSGVEALPAGTETVLVVEDEPGVREMSRRMLEKLGYTVMTAPDGVEALKMMESDKCPVVDILMTDMIMPRMNGGELAGQITAIHPEIRVLYVSGYTDTFINISRLIKPGCEFLFKPFTQSELAHKIRAVIDSANT